MVLVTVGCDPGAWNWEVQISVGEKERISDEKHEAAFGSLLFWFCTAGLAYVLSIGPVAWLHEKTASARLKAGLETVYAPVVFLIEETPLKQSGEWWVWSASGLIFLVPNEPTTFNSCEHQARAQSAPASRWFLAFVWLAVREMNIPVRGVLGSQGSIVDHEQILGIMFFGLLREIERAG